MNKEPEATIQRHEQDRSGGIARDLGELPPGALIEEEALARIFGWHAVSVKRAVERGELPPPVRMFGKPCWMAGAILAHIEARLDSHGGGWVQAPRFQREASACSFPCPAEGRMAVP